MASGKTSHHGRIVSSAERDQRHAEPADIGLPLAADVEEAGVERDGDGQARSG